MTNTSDPRPTVPLSPGSPLKRVDPAFSAPAASPDNALAHGDADGEADASGEYDPADYRWVPVRRTPRYDGWTEEKQRRFIEVLADTGLVGAAAKAVGMSRESAYRLRRLPHGGAFARAWESARQHAAGLIEDIAFERAIQGVEHDVYNAEGEVTATRIVHDNRLLKFLLSHLKPERYGPARAATQGGNDRACPSAGGKPARDGAGLARAARRTADAGRAGGCAGPCRCRRWHAAPLPR